MKNKIVKIVFCIIAVQSIIYLSACSDSRENTKSNIQPDSTSQVERSTESEQTFPATEDFVTESTEEITDASDIDIFLVDESFVKNNQGFYKKDGEKYYTLYGFCPLETITSECIGFKDDYWTWLYGDVPNENEIVTYGEVPILSFEKDDRIVAYSSNKVPELRLLPADLHGYTPCIQKGPLGGLTSYSFVDLRNNSRIQKRSDDIQKLQVQDMNSNVLDDYRNLEKGSKCIVSWYEGTEYSEISMEANSLCYDFTYDNKIIVEGTLTKNGYAEYDLSDVPSGKYYTGSGGSIIEIL